MRYMWIIVFALSMMLCIVTENAQAQSLSSFPTFPWETWGEMSYAPGRNVMSERGAKLDGYAEQGVDWVALGHSKWIVNTFVGLRYTLSDHSDQWWNNKAGLWAGVKLVDRDLSPTKNGWGHVSVGVRGEAYTYFRGPHESEMRVVGFVKWTFGGDWKKSH